MAKKEYSFMDLFAGDNTGQVITDIRSIIEQGRKMAYAAAGQAAIATYWNIGRRIVEEEQRGDQRAEYGAQLIATLSDQLQSEYGRGYSRRNLAYYRDFYLSFKDLEILHTRVQNLTWSHIRRVLSVVSPQARDWYLKAASENMWSVNRHSLTIWRSLFWSWDAASLSWSGSNTSSRNQMISTLTWCSTISK